MNVSFIGGGVMAEAIISGVKEAGLGVDITVSEPIPERASYLKPPTASILQRTTAPPYRIAIWPFSPSSPNNSAMSRMKFVTSCLS